MSIFIEKDGKKVLPKSIYIKILFFLALIGVSAVIMQPVQYLLTQEMYKIRTNFIERLEEITGMEVRYSSLRPAFLGSFEIKNLRLVKNNEPFFTVSRIKINFSIIDLLLNRTTFIHTVQIDSPVLSIDREKDKDTLDFFSTLMNNRDTGNEGAFQQITELLPRHADYQIRHLYFNFIDGQTEYRIENMNINVREDGGNIVLFGRFYSELKIADIFDKTYILGMDTGISGECTNDLQNGSAELSVFYLTCSQQDQIRRTSSFFRPPVNNPGSAQALVNVLPFKVGIIYEDWTLKVKQNEENAADNYYFNYNIETGGVSAGIILDDYKPGDRIRFTDRLSDIRSILSLQITGGLLFEYENGFMNYNVNLLSEGSDESSDSFIINVYGNENEIIVNDFFVNSPENNSMVGLLQGSLGFSGNLEFNPLTSTGTVFFEDFSITGNESINAVFDISSHEGEILVSSSGITIAQAEINDFAAFLYPLNKDIGINVSGFFVEGGALYMDAVFNRNPREFEASLILESISFFEITELSRPFTDKLNIPAFTRAATKNSHVNAEVFFSTDFNNLVYNAPRITFNVGSTNGILSLSGTDRQFTLSEGLFYQEQDELHVSANVNFANPMDLFFTLNAGYLDQAWNIDGQIHDRSTLIIRDPNGLHVYGNKSANGALSGYIEGLEYPIALRSNPVYLNFFISLRYDSTDFWFLDINRFTAREAHSIDGMDFLRISGFADQDGASFREILYNDNTGILMGSADFSWDTDFSYLEYIVDITDGREYGEKFNSTGVFRDDHIDVKVSVSELNINRFSRGTRSVVISAEADAAWDSINSFNANINLSKFRTRLRDNFVDVSVLINFTNDELLVNNMNLDIAGVNITLPELQFNRAEGIAKAKANIHGNALERIVDGKIEFDANFNQIESWLNFNQAARKFNGKLSVANFQYGELKEDNFILVFAGNEGALSLRGGQRDMIRLELDSDGNFFAGFSAPFPFRGTLAGTVDNWIIDAHCNSFLLDISALYALVSTQKEFNIAGGYITGKADFKGPIWNPEFHGNAKATSMRFQVPSYVSDDIRVIPFDILAQGYEMTFGPVAIVSGNGGGNVRGWFYFENWSPRNVGLDIQIPRERPIPYDVNIAGFLARGTASGKFNMFLDSINMLIDINGDLFTNAAELGINMDEMMSNNPDGESFSEMLFHTTVDLKITAGSMVEFVWPTLNPILKANPEMGTVIYISSDSNAGQYSLNSDIRIRSGELNYLDRSFFIRQGRLVFRENETSFDPRISARAETRDRADSGPVTIAMIIDNQPLFSFEPRFEASPSLTQLEIYSILGQTFNSAQGEDDPEMAQRLLLSSAADIVSQVIATSDFLSQFVFLRQFERQFRDALGLDIFSVRTRFINNVVMTTGVPGSRQVNDETVNIFGNYFDNTTVFVGKYIGQYMFAHAMLTMKYDESSNLFGGLRLEPDIGIELQSPFINIRWDFYPNHPENWWVNDNSITLSWSKSF